MSLKWKSLLFSLVILAPMAAIAQVPTHTWQIDTAQRPAPYALELIRGESITLVPQYLNNGAAASLQTATNAELRYRSADMDADTFYRVDGVITSNTVRFEWDATHCAAATNFNYAIAVQGAGLNLRSYGTIKLIGVVSGIQTTNQTIWAPRDWSDLAATLVTNGGATIDGMVISNGAAIVTAADSVSGATVTNIVGGIMATGACATAATVTGPQSNTIATALQPAATNGWEIGTHTGLVTRTQTNGWETGPHTGLATNAGGAGAGYFAMSNGAWTAFAPGVATESGSGWQNPSNVSFFTWTTNASKTGISITGYNTNGGTHPVIPRFINGYPVIDIKGGQGWGDGAFFGLDPELQNIDLPDTLQTIGQGAFYWTGLRSVTIPASVTNIGEDAFAVNTHLTNVSFKGNAPANGYRAFNWCDQMTVYVLDPLATGWGSTWYGRPVVRPKVYTDVAFQDHNTTNNMTSAALISGVLSTKTPGAEVGKLTLSTSYAGADPAGRNDLVLTATGAASNNSLLAIAGDVTVGGELTGGGVVKTNDARYLASVTNETDPVWGAASNTVRAGAAAGATAWQNPASATNWTWTSDGTQITLTGYTGPNAVVIPDMLDALPVTGFGTIFQDNTAMTSVSGGANVTSIDDNALSGCSALTSVILPSVTSVGDRSVQHCTALLNISLPVATSIGEYAFWDCASMTSVSLPETTRIRNDAFSGCTVLTTVSLPNATAIESYAFYNCSYLTSVRFGQNAPSEASNVYILTPNVTNYVTNPTATGWGATWNGRSVVRLPVYAQTFYGSGAGLTNVILNGVLGSVSNGIASVTSMATGYEGLRNEVDDMRYELAVETFNQYGYRVAVSYDTPMGSTDYFSDRSDINATTSTNWWQFGRQVMLGGTSSNLVAWGTAQSLPGARSGPAAAVLNGQMYAIGGRDAGNVVKADVYRYSEASNSWASVGSLPAARYALAAAVLNGQMYAIGGSDAGSVAKADVYRYSEASNSWSSVASLPAARYALAAAVLNGQMYAIGGYDAGSVAKADVYRYSEASNSWASVGSLPAARNYPAAAVLNGQMYAIGGYDGSVAKADVYRYSEASNSWSSVASLPAARYGPAAAVLNGQMYSIGGRDAVVKADVYRYSEASNSWSSVGSLPAARYYSAAAVLNGKMYSIGGYDAGIVAKADVYRTAPQETVGGSLVSSITPLSFPANRMQSFLMVPAIYSSGLTNYAAAVYGTHWSNLVSANGGTNWTYVPMSPVATVGMTNVWAGIVTHGLTAGTALVSRIDVGTNVVMWLQAWQRWGGQQ